MNVEKITVSVDTNIPELSEKVKRLQQVIAEAKELIEEINGFEAEIDLSGLTVNIDSNQLAQAVSKDLRNKARSQGSSL